MLPMRQMGVQGRFSSRANIGGEIKTLDNRFSGAYTAGTYSADTEPFQQIPINATAQVVQALNLVQQGTGIAQRVGNKISLKSVRLRLYCNYTGVLGAATGPYYCRIMLIYDRQTNGAYPSLSSILGYARQDNTVATGTYLDNINPNQYDRYQVLMDKFHFLPTLTSDTDNTTTENGVIINEYVKLKNLSTQFNTTANPLTIGGISVGGLYLCVWGSPAQAANVSDNWQWNGTSRLRFYDN